MRVANKNKQALYYALFVQIKDVYDVNGRKTGQHETEYGDPVKVFMNISAARGTSEVEQFGINVEYSKTLVTDDMSCPIVEGSILWIGKEPVVDEVKQPHNYVVTQVAKSINGVCYAIKEVDVSANNIV